MPDGSVLTMLHMSPGAEPRSPGRRTYGMAATIALALHGAVLLPLFLWSPKVQPPDIVAAVELTPVTDGAAPASPDRPVTESASTSATPEPTQAVEATSAPPPPPPDASAAVKEAEVAPTPPPPTQTPPTPETVAVQPPPDAAQLASIEPPMADVPAELVQAQPPPPEAVIAEAPPLPSPPVPPVTPPPPRPARPVPPRPVARPAPRPDVSRPDVARTDTARASPSAAPASAPAATTPSQTAAAAPSSNASNASPTWRSELSARLQRAKRYPEAARDRGDQGVATATFTMDRNGRLLSASLVRSSGSPVLDEEAVALIHRAEPLPPMPAEMAGTTITLTVPITFSLR